MEYISYNCPACGVVLRNDASQISEIDSCPECGQEHSVPEGELFQPVSQRTINFVRKASTHTAPYIISTIIFLALIIGIVGILIFGGYCASKIHSANGNKNTILHSNKSRTTTPKSSEVWATCVALAMEMESRGTPLTNKEVFSRVARSYNISSYQVEQLYWKEENKYR